MRLVSRKVGRFGKASRAIADQKLVSFISVITDQQVKDSIPRHVASPQWLSQIRAFDLVSAHAIANCDLPYADKSGLTAIMFRS